VGLYNKKISFGWALFIWLACIILVVLALTIYDITSAQMIVDHKGHPHKRVEGKSQQPKTIVDTVRLSSGVGSLVLQSEFKKNQHTTKPQDYIYATANQIITDTSQDVYSYAVYWNSDTLIIKSSSATDSSLVVVKALIK